MTVGFETSKYSLREGMSSPEVCILLEGGQLDRPVDITLFSSDRTAHAQADYARLFTTQFEPSDGNTHCVDIAIIDDSLVERNETFTLALISNDSAVSLTSQSATVVIIDNDQAMFGFVHNTYTVNEGGGQGEIAIQLLGGQSLEREIFVHLESSDGSAIATNSDYTAFRKALTFSPGSSPGTVESLVIDIFDDNLVEEVEYFTVHAVSMDSAVQFEVGKENATIFIKDNDCKLVCMSFHSYSLSPFILNLAITLSLESVFYSVMEGDMVETCVTIEIGQLERNIRLSVVSIPGSAQEGEDYTPLILSLTLHPGENRTCFIIESLDDDMVEGEETLKVILSSQDKAVAISTINTTTISIQDLDGKQLIITTS